MNLKSIINRVLIKRKRKSSMPTYQSITTPASAHSTVSTSHTGVGGGSGLVNTIACTAGNYASSSASTATAYQAGLSNGSFTNSNLGIGSGTNIGAIHSLAPYSILSITNWQNKELVRLNCDGTVTWADGIEVDEAAKMFANSISIGAEMKAGISNRIKSDMRNTVFEELIEIAKMRGSLSVDDLTFAYESSKIIEKLKGV